MKNISSIKSLIICVSIFLLMPFYLLGQNQFNRNYDFGNTWAEWGWNVNIDSGLFIVFRAAWPLTNSNSSLLFNKFDQSGNIVYGKVIDTLINSRYNLGLSNCVKPINNGYAGVGTIERLAPNYNRIGYLFKTNFNGDTSFIKNYFIDSSLFIVYNFVSTSDNGYSIIGVVQDTNNLSKIDIYLLKTDSDGNELWNKRFGSNSNAEYGYFVYELPNKNLIISGEKKVNSNQYQPWIIVTDSAGNLINQKVWSAGAMVSEGGYASLGLKNQIIKYGVLDTVINAGDYVTPSYIGELNSDFTFKWRTILNSTEQNYIYLSKQMQDSSFVLVGVKLDPVDSNGSHPQGWIAKLDRDGNFLWEHLYKYCISEANYFSDFQQLPDGGFIVAGNTIGCDSAQTLMTSQDLWLVRLDSNGCLLPGCFTNANTIEVGKNKLDTYPNPTNDVLNIDWWLKRNDKATLVIYNLLGQTVLQQQLNSYQSTIGVTDLFSGLYIITINNGVEKLESKFLKQ